MRAKRKEKLKALMQSGDWGLDYLVLFLGPSFYYFTGLSMQIHERPTLLFIGSREKDAIFLPKLESPNASTILGDEYAFYIYTDEEGPDGILSKLGREMDLSGKKIGIEHFYMRVHEYELLRRHAPGAAFVDAGPLVAEIRMCKDQQEVAFMKKAAEITEKALEETLEIIRPGVTEQEVAAFNKIRMFSHGSGELWKQPIVTSGPRTAYPHAKTSTRKIEAGDLVMIDTGAFHQGYGCDLTRTVAVGAIDDELKIVYETVREAVEAVLRFSRDPLISEELDRAARDVIEGKGYGKYFIHRTGHGLGLEGHEPPYIIRGNRMALKNGMTFTVEPGIYLPGRGGVRIEDDVVVKGDRLEALTGYSRQLRIL